MSILALITNILFVGHSLVGPDLPPLLESALAARGHTAHVSAQLINGATLRYNWDHSAEAEGVDARAHLARGLTDVLILTEAIPLAPQIEWNDTATQIAAFAGLALEANPETRTYLYETWHSLTSGLASGPTSNPDQKIADDPGANQPWRDRLTQDLSLWQGLADAATAQLPQGAPPVRIIPAGQAMALASDAAAAGRLPGIPTITGLFRDDIHPNGKGLYLVAMVHLATISGESPVGLPAKLTRHWQSRDDAITDAQALALQRIAWAATQAQFAHEAAAETEAETTTQAATAITAETKGETKAAPQITNTLPPAALTTITNPNLALGLAGINDWAVQQPFLDLMKTARPWTGHLPGQWGGWDHARLNQGGYLDKDGWPLALPPEVTGLSTLILTDLPEGAGGLAGRYVLRYQGRGNLRLEGRAEHQKRSPGRIEFDYTPGPGAVLITLTQTDPADPIRALTVLRTDRVAAHAAGAIFNPDWLARIRGVRALRFMDWMATNDSPLARLQDRPKPSDYTWARIGVPIEVLVALANELHADPWFNMPHLAEDALVRAYATAARDGLAPGLRAHVEYSNEVWNWQFAQARWAEEQGRARWGRDQTWVQFYALRAAEIADIWAQTYGDAAPARLVRVIATQTGWLGLETAILDAPLVLAEGRPAPATAFDAYAVTGYFAALLGSDEKRDMVLGWLTESTAAATAEADAKGLKGASRAADIDAHRYDLATTRAAQELIGGAISGHTEDTLAHLLGQVLPYQAEVARAHGLQLMMYEGGSHVTGLGAQTENAALTAFFQHLNFTPEMGALYHTLMTGWANLTDAPFNAFVDVYAPTKWGSWGALRHLRDDNPRWQALAQGCPGC